VSGRMSTRYADPFRFDHGAQYFTARSEAFQSFLAPLIHQGLIAPWEGKIVTIEAGKKPYKRDWFEPHYVAVPKMNQLCKALAEGQDVRIQAEVAQLIEAEDGWHLQLKDGTREGPYDWVISTAPAPQTMVLLPEQTSFHDKLAKVKMTGCYSVMLGFENPLGLHFDGAKVNASPIGWLAMNHRKPGRGAATSLLIQSTNDWAEAHMDDDKQARMEDLIVECEQLLGMSLQHATLKQVHRWKYANTATPLGEDYGLDAHTQLAACGDWCVEGRVESAFISAHQLSQKLLDLG